MLSHLTITGLECKNCGNILSVKMWFLIIPCFHAFLLPCFHASMLPCFHVFMLQYFHDSMIPASMLPGLHVRQVRHVRISISSKFQKMWQTHSQTDMTTYTDAIASKNSISVGGGEFCIIDFFTDMFYIVKRSLKVKTTITLNHHKWKSLRSKSWITPVW